MNRSNLSRTASEDPFKATIPVSFEEQLGRLGSMTRILKYTMLELLVSVSGLLSTEDYVQVASPLWNCMDEKEAKGIAPVRIPILDFLARN